MAPVVITDTSPVSADLRARVENIFKEGTCENTRIAYRSDLRYFWAWAGTVLGLGPAYPVLELHLVRFIVDHFHGMSPETDLRLMELGYKAKSGPLKISTITRKVVSLSRAHVYAGIQAHENPCKSGMVRELLKKARRASIKRGIHCVKKRAAPNEIVLKMLATCAESPAGIRDQALILFIYASGGRRRSEAAQAKMCDITRHDDYYLFRLKSSKTDQEGKGLTVPLHGRAAAALHAWLKISGIESGPVFRRIYKSGRIIGDKSLSPQSVTLIVKKRARLAGFDPADFGGHSLRSGFVTEGGKRGIGIFDIMAMSGHRHVQTVLEYYQPGAVINNPAAKII